MKLKWIAETEFLVGTKGKVYDALASREIGKTKKDIWYKILDDSNDTYWYPEKCFEVVDK